MWPYMVLVMVVMVVIIFTQDLRTLMFKIIIMARLMLKSFGGCTVDQREGRRSGGKGAQMRPWFSSSSTSKPADKIPNSCLYFVKTIDEQKSLSIFSHVQSVSFKSKANLSSWFLLSWNSETFDFLNVRPFKNKTNASSVSIHLLTLVPHKSSYHIRQKPQFQCETHIRLQ